jgi:galactose mutarotase-like enzyme
MAETLGTREHAVLEPIELRSSHGELEASFVPSAGMLGSSLRHRGVELLAHPCSLRRHVETGHPTALPLLHPWANRLAAAEYQIAGRRVRLDPDRPNVHVDPSGLPIHGLVAGFPHWRVLEEGYSRLRARLDFGAWPELLEGFPFPHLLELAANLNDERLEIETTLSPTDDSAVPIAFGFHPYLRIPDLPRQEWLVELPVTSRMELDERMLPTGRSTPVQIPPGRLGDRAFDDGFDGLARPTEFAVCGAGRRISVRFGEGYRFAQVYAPAGSQFICFEPMTAPIDPFGSERTLIAEPGTSYVARFSIAVEDRA